MKIILIPLIFTLATLTSFAQVDTNSSANLTFKGVPIYGTLNEYVSKMKKNGFTHITTEDGIAILEGDLE